LAAQLRSCVSKRGIGFRPVPFFVHSGVLLTSGHKNIVETNHDF